MPKIISSWLPPLWLGAVLLALASPSVAGERYVSASVDEAGNLRILSADGRTITITKEEGQVGFDQIAISSDGMAVGWVGLRTNCCTSYPIPTRLVVYSSGESRKFVGVDLPVWRWRFTPDGKQVGFHQETVHGGFGTHYELRDIVTGRLRAKWDPAYGPDNHPLPNQTPPMWVRELNLQQ